MSRGSRSNSCVSDPTGLEVARAITPGVETPNELWTVATADGLAWFVAAVPPTSPDARFVVQPLGAVSGTRLLTMTSTGDWHLVDLE